MMFPIDFLRHSALAIPDAVAAIDGERRYTYRALMTGSDAVALAFQSLTGKDRPTVGILGPNNIEMLVALMAIHACGAVLVPLNARNATAELDSQIAFAGTDILVIHREYLDRISPPGVPVLVADAERGDPRSLEAHMEKSSGARPRWTAAMGDVNGIKFTGGSSGKPKGVMQSFRCVNTLVASVIIGFDLKATDCLLCAAPMTHGAGALLLPILARGGRVVMTADSNPANLLDIIARERVTTTWIPPTLLYKLIDEQRAHPRDVSSLSHLIWGGAAASAARLREAVEVFGPVVEVAYGQTEAPLILSVGRAGELSGDRIASVGRIGPLADVAILDPEGNELGPNTVGEICARGDLLMNGYRDMPEETAKTIHGGWLHTGDLGMLDENGFLYVKGRSRDVVITGGFNVYPSDVEAVIATHPAVSEVVVFGVPDDYWGERLEGSIEVRDGFAVSEQDVIAYCKERLGSVKAPKRIHIVASLPRSPVGKVLRREARAAAGMA